MEHQDTKDRSRLFNNPLLEALSHTHIAYPLIIFYGFAAGLMIYTLYEGLLGAGAGITLFLGGFLVFTLVEYLIHRYAYHIPITTPARERFQYIVHGVHHEHPRDKTRLAMPPLLSIVLATAFFLLYKLLMGTYGIPFTAGFVAGYATYLCVHYSVHAFPPPNNIFRQLWIHHALHHYQQPEAAFGVSSPLWDVIFRTMPEKRNSSIRTGKGMIDDHQSDRV